MIVPVTGGAGICDYIHVVDLAKSAEKLRRKAEKDLNDTVRDAWRRQRASPMGYGE